MVKDAPSQTPGIETLKASIGIFDQLSADYRRRAELFELARRDFSILQNELRRNHTHLRVTRHDLIEERERQLRANLKSQGLAICVAEGDWVNAHNGSDSVWTASWDELNKLGVFPKDQMTMVYSEDFGHAEFRIYCQAHAPASTEQKYKVPEENHDRSH